ncbi:MAG: LysR family transcriptional regulator, partial [Clostridia bacterium]|nr:LysR family transcriptional regulator [Clostridia bacterium]
MNFTTLKYFLTAAEELNITRAAARLFISQQALSSHIGKLEAELGVKLFDRLPSLTLTYAGRRMVEYAQQAVNLERQIHQMAGDVNNDQVGELRVGISHTCGRAILPSILPRFRRTHPLVDIKLVEDNSAEMEKELRQGDLDLMIDFLPKPQEGLVHEELITERLFLVVPKVLLESSYGACLEPIKSECNRDLDMFLFEKFPFILLSKGNRVRKVLDAYMEKIGFKPKIVLETENTETAYELAGRGMGVTVYPELFLWCIPRP